MEKMKEGWGLGCVLLVYLHLQVCDLAPQFYLTVLSQFLGGIGGGFFGGGSILCSGLKIVVIWGNCCDILFSVSLFKECLQY